MNAPLLYRCEPLSARITVAQCSRNATQARQAKKYPLGSPGRLSALRLLETCPGCPGVLDLARQADQQPQPYTGTPEREASKRRHGRRIKSMRGRSGKAAVSKSGTITLAQVMEMTGLGRRHLRGALKRAGIPVVAFGARSGNHGRPPSLYARDRVEAWIDRRKGATRSPVPDSRTAEASNDAQPITTPGDLLQRIDAELDEAKAKYETLKKESEEIEIRCDALLSRINSLSEAKTALARVEALLDG